MPPPKQLIVIGASSGGIEAVRELLGALPPMLQAPVCVVIHVAPSSPGILDRIFGRGCALPVSYAVNHERLHDGHVYLAPSDYHLLVEPGRLVLSAGPKENRVRPAIDPLFRSAAQVYGPAAIGVVLTGNLDDGASGLQTIAQLGGTAVVQDPREAQFPSMPENALAAVPAASVLSIDRIAPFLVSALATEPGQRRPPLPTGVDVEVQIAKGQNVMEAGLEKIATPSSFACPECHGVLYRLKETHPERFRCHTGHAFSARHLIAAIEEDMESTTWSAVRSLQEGSMLLAHMAADARAANELERAGELEAAAERRKSQAELLRQALIHRPLDEEVTRAQESSSQP
jgi:two-component system chemotaxis response regulator CheB